MSPFPSFAPIDEVASSIEAYIRERFQIARDDKAFSRQSSLWEEGYMDSIGVVELVVFIESTFGVMLPDEAFFDPAFTTIDGIARIVGGLSAQRVA